MNTPIADFVRAYAQSGTARLHMPGHKGRPFLGPEPLDITELAGADSLYEADGIIARSEANAAALFGSGRTVYGTEGSSQCVKAMLHLALTHREPGMTRQVLAARNVHKSFLYAAALLDLEVVWLEGSGLCSCIVTPAELEQALSALAAPPMAVYLTSPDYLGGMADIAGLAQAAHRFGTRLLVDNAHGAYLRFLEQPRHPLELGADLCCDSAHKTLPVLTGGAYLHASADLPEDWLRDLKSAMAPYGSTSPSYLILASLDLCNEYLTRLPAALPSTAACLEEIRQRLRQAGFVVLPSDPLRLTVCAPKGSSGLLLARRLRQAGIECEYADPEYLVLMATPENSPEELMRISTALGRGDGTRRMPPPIPAFPQEISIRQAMLAPHRRVPAQESVGAVCAAPTVACPPAIPIAVSGQRIGPEAAGLFRHYGISVVEILPPENS